jgi:hypothetical protein
VEGREKEREREREREREEAIYGAEQTQSQLKLEGSLPLRSRGWFGY